jgi:bifunctional DNA-binding transcriptional regulator/antitoxin component of YhaV-PrlF toxin-antitoxin module
MRRVLGIEEGDQLEITLEGDHVAIRPRIPTVIASFNLSGKKRVTFEDETVTFEPGDYVIEKIGRKR